MSMGHLNDYDFSDNHEHHDQNGQKVLDIVSTNNVFVASYKCGTVKVYTKTYSFFKSKRF